YSKDKWHYNYEDVPFGASYFLDGVYNHDYFLIRGFAVVVSAGLGTNGSDGLETCGSIAEVDAFKNVVEWINHKDGRHAFADREGTVPIEADWSNGRVAMRGCSYNATMAYEVAATGVEGLETIVPEAGIASWYEYSNTQGVSHFTDNKYTTFLARGNSSRFFGADPKGVSDNNLRTLCSKLFGYFDKAQQELKGHFGPYWSRREYSDSNNIKASALIVQGFNDYNVRTKQADLMRMAFERNNRDVRMILHQDGHATLERIDIDGMFYEDILNKWYCRYLLGVDNDIENTLPKVYVQSNIDGSFSKYDSWYGGQSITLSSGNVNEITLDHPANKAAAETDMGTTGTDEKINVPSKTDIMKSGDDPYYDIDDFLSGLDCNAEGVSEDGSRKFTETWIKRVPEEITIQGKAEVHVKAAVPQIPSSEKMVLGAMLYDISEESFDAYEGKSDDESEVEREVYLENFIYRGPDIESFDLELLKQTNVKKKLITKGVIDLGSPNAGYEPRTAVKGSISANTYYDYTIHMLPTVYTVRPGHYLWLYLIPGMDGADSDTDVIVHNGSSYADIPVSEIPEGFDKSDFDEECKDDGKGGRMITEKVGGREVAKKIITSENKITTVSSNIWIKGLDPEYIYMGEPVKPEIEVYDGTDPLTLNKDYRISYSGNGKPTSVSGKDAILTVVFKGEYVNTKKIVRTFKIGKTRLMDAYPGDDPDVIVTDAAAAYTGRKQKPVPEIRYSTGAQKIINKNNFRFTYNMIKDVSGNTVSGAAAVALDHVMEPGEYKITIEPKNARSYFTGKMTTTLKVIKDKNRLLKNAKVEFNPRSYVYTGEEIMLKKGTYTLKLKLDGRKYSTLSENTDFVVSLSRNNTEPGKAQIVFAAKPGNAKGLAGNVTGYFTITKGRDLNGPDKNKFTYGYENYVSYAKSGAVPSWILVRDGDKELILGKDYSVSYKDHKKRSTDKLRAKLIIKGKGKYKGTVTKEYDVVTANIARLNISVKDKKMVKNLPKGAKYRYENPVITVTDEKGKKLVKNKDYKIADDGYETLSANGVPVTRDDQKPGLIRITIEGMGNYFGKGTVEYMYYDKNHDLSKAGIWKPIAPKTYTGTEITLTKEEMSELLVVGRTSKNAGTFLNPDEDFYIESYKNNINTGTAKVILRGKGLYGGTKTISFKIKRRAGKDFIGVLKGGVIK
ncbi:MAG: hypothetical protein K6E88_09435, partial [Lachnospiraceae bacterium]|nr:hypothetical protein [Lachnospiraceae bacterium]